MKDSNSGGPLGQVFALVFAILIGFTVALVFLAFPAGFYATFGPGASQDPWTTIVHPFLLVGPVALLLPFTSSAGAYFIFLSLVYVGLFAFVLSRPPSPMEVVSRSMKQGVGALVSSPFFVAIISIAFLIFTASIIDAFASGSGPPVTLLSLSQAPLIEEFGFRMLLIGLVPAVLSLSLPWRKILGVLWRPSSAYSGTPGGGPVRAAVIVLLFLSSVFFGVAHVVNGWSFGKIFEASYGGVVLGYLYIRFGFAFAVIAHWGIDYFDTVYTYLGQSAFHVPATAQPEFFLQAAVDIDMLQLMGLASFLLVVYLWLKKIQARSEGSEVHKDGAEGSVFGI